MANHPFFDAVPFPWMREDALTLHRLLAEAIMQENAIRMLFKAAGGDGTRWAHGKAAGEAWEQVFDLLVPDSRRRLLTALQSHQNVLGHAALQECITAIFALRPVTEKRMLSPGVLLLDRTNLRTYVSDLASPDSRLRVVLVRGAKKTGKTRGRYLFETVARNAGARPIYLNEDLVGTVDDVIFQLFSAWGKSREIPKLDPTLSTEEDWYRRICANLQEFAFAARQQVWIAIDDLGPGPDGKTPLLDSRIRDFCDMLALNMLNPAFAEWHRLMFIHYPEDVPTRWPEEAWIADTTSDTDIKKHHVEECLREWAAARNRNLVGVGKRAAEVMAKADAGPAEVPRLRRIHDALVAALRDLDAEPA